MITANQAPDHATIARFRARHQEALAELFGQVLGLCTEAGLVGVAVLAVDGLQFRPRRLRFGDPHLRGARQGSSPRRAEADAGLRAVAGRGR